VIVLLDRWSGHQPAPVAQSHRVATCCDEVMIRIRAAEAGVFHPTWFRRLAQLTERSRSIASAGSSGAASGGREARWLSDEDLSARR